MMMRRRICRDGQQEMFLLLTLGMEDMQKLRGSLHGQLSLIWQPAADMATFTYILDAIDQAVLQARKRGDDC